MRPLLPLLATFTLTACTDSTTTKQSLSEIQTKLNQLQGQVASLSYTVEPFIEASVEVHDKEHRGRVAAALYSLSDVERKNLDFAWLLSSRHIGVGEIVAIDGDMWRVEATKVITDQIPTDAANSGKQRTYGIRYTALIVRFYARETAPTTMDSTPKPQSP